MRRFVGLACGLLAMALVPSVAFADEVSAPLPPSEPPAPGSVTESATATVDTIQLRNGGMFRGRVTEIVPGDHVTIVLTTGEARRLTWRDVDRVIVASTAVPPAATPPVAMVGPRARVHIKAPHPSFLYRRAAGTSEFVIACEASCDAEMPIGDTYKIGGSGFSTTPEFKLDAAPGGSVELTVDGPNWFGIIGGGLITITGGVTAYVGAIFALSGGGCSAVDSGSTYSSRSSSSGCSDLRNVGIGALAVGAGMIALGLIIVYPSLKTDFSQQKGGGKDAFVRRPTWRSASSTPALEGAAPATFPLLYEGRF